ncbi:MAG: CcmD family protein [Ignavibacteria bacterium]|nr:CcmD family protein [Ignavibacteria bacterium]
MNSLYDFFSNNQLYIVLFIAIVIWVGIFIYLFRIDKKLTKLENRDE